MAQLDKTLPPIELEPEYSAKKTIIWLHGLGADGSDFTPIVPELKLPADLNIRFIFPHAPMIPVTINNGQVMRAWYDIFSLIGDRKIDHEGIRQSEKRIHQLIEKEKSRGISEENIILAGFSQGAVMTLATGLAYPKRLGGLIALSGYLPFPENVLAERLNPANEKTPVFIAHGTEDKIVPYALGKAAYLNLKKAALPLSWHAYEMGHTVCQQEIHDISQWIINTLEH